MGSTKADGGGAQPAPAAAAKHNGKPYGQIVLTLSNQLLPEEKLAATPSQLDGLDAETETDLRIYGCELIQTAGILLRLPQVAMATGQVLLQRFYYSRSMVRHPVEHTAMACVCLASKIEEAQRVARHVINVFTHIRQVNSNKWCSNPGEVTVNSTAAATTTTAAAAAASTAKGDVLLVKTKMQTRRPIAPVVLDQNYVQLKNQVISAERRILKELGFCVHIKHPHKIIVMYLQVLCLERHANLMQYSWNYMNDSLRTDVFVRYQPETVACACIYLTARKLKLPLPKNPAWYTIFGVCERDIRDVCARILRLYTRPKPNVEELERKVDELRRKYQDAKLRAKGNSGTNTPNHNNSPSSGDAAPAKTTGAHNAWGGFISRSGSHVVPAIASEKKSRSRTRSPSHSPSKHHKRSKKHKSRSRSPTKRKSHKRRSYSRSRSRSNSPHKRKQRDRRKSRSASNDRENRNDSRYIDRYEKYDRYKEDRYEEKDSRSKKYEREGGGGGDKDRYSRRAKHREEEKDTRDRDRSRDERSKDRRR